MNKFAKGIVIIIAVIVLGLGSYALMRSGAPRVAQTTALKKYVALGDSVAAGVGLDTPSDYSACDRTDESYPHQLASLLGYQLTNIACSGATIPVGIAGKQTVNKLALAPQLNQIFSRKAAPDLVSLTIGANDTGWIHIIGECYTGTCGTADQTNAVGQRLAVLDTNLSNVLNMMKAHYGLYPPRTVITDYYQVFPKSVEVCSDLQGIDSNERVWGRQLEDMVNARLKAIAIRYAFVAFVHIDFSGHELCTPDSWIQGLQDAMPYHPTKAGQMAIAHQIDAAITSHR